MMNNLNSIWPVTDENLIESKKYGHRNIKEQCENKDSIMDACLQRNSTQSKYNIEYDSDHSECTLNSENCGFAAIPKEFRPNKSTKNLLPITSKNDTLEGRRDEEVETNVSELHTDRHFYDGEKITNQAEETESRFKALKDFWNSKSNEMKLKNKNQPNMKSNFNPEANHEVEQTCSYIRDKTHSIKHSSIMHPNISEKKGKTLHEEFLEISFTHKIQNSSSDLKSENQISENTFQPFKNQLKSYKFCENEKWEREKGEIMENKTPEPNVKNEPKKYVESYKRQTVKSNSNLRVYKRNEVEDKVLFRYISTEENEGKEFGTAYGDCLKQRTIPCTSKRQHFVNKAECENESFGKTNSRSLCRNTESKKEIPEPVKTLTSTSAKSRKRAPRNRRKNATNIRVIKHEIRIIHVNEPNKNEKDFDTISEMGKQFHSTASSENEDHESQEKYRYSEGISIKKNINCHMNKLESNAKPVDKQLDPKKDTIFIQKFPKLSTEKGTVKKDEFKMSSQAHVNCAADQQNMFPLASETGQSDIPRNILLDNQQSQIALLIQYGREISDIIAGSYVGMNAFLSIYDEWLISRDKTMYLLEQFAENVSKLKEKNKKISRVNTLVKTGANVVAAIPVAGWQLAAVGQVIAILSSFFSKIFQATPSLSDSGLTESELMQSLQEDVEATSVVYMYATQCDRQFQDACRLIEEFQHDINDGRFASLNEIPEYGFLHDLKDCNLKSPTVYYRRLYKCFEGLKGNPSSDISKPFCRTFEGSSEEIATIKQLQWRFHAQITDSETVAKAWDDICMFFLDADSKCYQTLWREIQKGIETLLKERCTMERDVKKLMQYRN